MHFRCGAAFIPYLKIGVFCRDYNRNPLAEVSGLDLTPFIIKLLLYIAPLYFANSSAMLSGGKTPLDLDRNFADGRPVFGRGKTFKGTLFGIAVGTGVSAILVITMPEVTGMLSKDYLLLGFLLSAGAIFGDIAASFFKRRSNITQGTQVFVVDQLDFVVGGMIFGSVLYVPQFYEMIIICIATLIIHRASNFVAFKIKLKGVPW